MASSVTPRFVADSVRNVIDYLTGAELVLAPNPVAESSSRISWHAADPSVPFLDSRDHTTISQYLAWLNAGNYSCVLFDGSLLQMSYALEKGRVIGHRLAYVPCPWQFDLSLIREGLALDEVFELCSSEDVLLRSPVRFDYDPAASRLGHPAAHMTLNSSECRIACVAPSMRIGSRTSCSSTSILITGNRITISSAWRHIVISANRSSRIPTEKACTCRGTQDCGIRPDLLT